MSDPSIGTSRGGQPAEFIDTPDANLPGEEGGPDSAPKDERDAEYDDAAQAVREGDELRRANS